MVKEALEETNVELEVTYAFGSQCGRRLRDAVFFADEDGQCLVNVVGRQVAFQHIDSEEANYVLESTNLEAVTACTISQSRSLLAICARCGEPFAQVSVYDIRALGTRPKQTLEEIGGVVGDLSCCAFSCDEEATFLCLFATYPENLVIVLDWRKNFLVGKCVWPNLIDRVHFCPMTSSVFSMSGHECFRLWKVGEEELEVLPPIQGLELQSLAVVDHAWLVPSDDTVIVCVEGGPAHIIDFDQKAIIQTIRQPFPDMDGELEAHIQLRSVCCFMNGFAFGGDLATVSMWERSVEGQVGDSPQGQGTDSPVDGFAPTCTKRIRTANAAVTCLDVAGESDDKRVILGFADSNVGHMMLSALHPAAQEQASSKCAVISGGFHSGPIVAIDVAAMRPIIVSLCREESTLRVWNYSTRQCEFTWEFPAGEEPLGLAIHPHGFLIAVSFNDKLRFMQLLVSELKSHRDVSIRGVRILKFSNGGHLLATIQGKLVVVYSTRTLSKVAALRGNSQQVVSVSFDTDDNTLTTCSEDGCLCTWSTQNWVKLYDHTTRVEGLAVAAGRDAHTFSSTVEESQSMLRCFKECRTLEKDLGLPVREQLNTMCLHVGFMGTTLVAGTSTGALRVCCPLADSPTWKDLGVHAGACTSVILTADNRTLVTAGEDGVIFLINVKGLVANEGAARTVHRTLIQTDYDTPENEVVMTNQSEIQARLEELQQLRTDNDTLKVQLVEDAARLEEENARRIVEARRRDQAEIKNLHKKYESLQQTATARERESLRSMKAMEMKHVKKANEFEHDYDLEVKTEADRHAAVHARLAKLDEQLEKIQEEGTRRLEQRRYRWKQQLRVAVEEKEAELQRLKDMFAFTKHRFNLMVDQEAMEHDLEVAELTKKNTDDLEQQRLSEYKLRKEQDTLVRGLNMMEKERSRITDEQEETDKTIANLKAEQEELKIQVASLKEERRDREKTLREKELEISSHKVKVNTLKKFKQVLDFKLREVTQSLKPKDHKITQLHTQLHKLEAEFEGHLEMQKQMKHTLDQKDQQVVELMQEGDKLRDAIKERERTIDLFNADLHKLVNEEQDVRRWPQGIRKIYRDHVDPNNITKTEDTLPLQELTRQIDLMERKVSTLTSKGKVSEKGCRDEIVKKTEENSKLIQELSVVRVENTALQREAKDLELRVRAKKQRLADIVMEREKALAASLKPRSCSPAILGRPQTPSGLSAVVERTTCGGKPMDMLPSGPRGSLRKTAGRSHKSVESRRHLDRLLLKADVNEQQMKMQKLENKLLQDQLCKLAEGNHKPILDSGRADGTGPSKRVGTLLSSLQQGSLPVSTLDSEQNSMIFHSDSDH